MSPVVLIGAVENWPSIWLTPLWLLGVGALGGLVSLLLIWGLLWLVSRLPGLGGLYDRLRETESKGMTSSWSLSLCRTLVAPFSRRTIAEVPSAIREGALWPVFIVVASLVTFGVVGVVFVQEPGQLLTSLARLPYVGVETIEFDVPVSQPEDATDAFSPLRSHEEPVSFKANEVKELAFDSDQNLLISVRPFVDLESGGALEVIGNETTRWYRRSQASDLLVDEDVTRLYIRNLGGETASVDLTITTRPPHPEVTTIPITAVAIVILFLLYLWQRAAFPRLSAIALAAYKSEVAQPLFMIVLVLGLFLLWLFIWIPYNTFGEDIKMLKDSGLTLVMILGIFLAIWAASNSIADEIEGKTALTVLSKPVGRRSFILGKFLGIIWTQVVFFTLLGIMLLIVVAYKPIHEARESSTQDLTWQLCHLEMIFTVPGLALAFMETVVMGAISVAISTRLPMLANFVICLAIYLLGHLTPLIVQSSMGQFVFVQFFGQLIATVFPNLDHFNIQAAVAAGLPVPHIYLLGTLLYCLVYSLIAMLLALVLFEDRDMA